MRRSGGAALVGADRIQYGDTGAGRSGNRSLPAAAAQPFTKCGLVVLGRDRAIDEAMDEVEEPGRVVVKREMSGILEDFELGARHRGVRHVRVANRDDDIL